MATFYPGPSKVYPQVRQYMLDAYDSGILSVNHRSAAFMDVCGKTLGLLHEKLSIPADYTIVFVSSATECWEIVAQSFTEMGGFHLYNGSFGQKWFEYARKLRPGSDGAPFGLDVAPDANAVPVGSEVICVTHNETSNGTQLPAAFIPTLRQTHPNSLIAVDATSSLGGADLPIAAADLWFASVQKCLGLPAGMGLLAASPRAVTAAERLADDRHYNSFNFIRNNIIKLQTHYTPNVLGVYLLMRVLEQVPPVGTVAERLRKQAADWYALFDRHPVLKPLVTNPLVRSDTVVAVTAAETVVAEVKKQAQAAGITLGNGYGAWKNSTFRIANFPAISSAEINQLVTLLHN